VLRRRQTTIAKPTHKYPCAVPTCHRRSPSPVDRHYKLHGTKPQRPSSCCEGYVYGTLSTAGIDGASPAAHRQKHLVTAAASDSAAAAAAAAGDLSQHDSSSSNSTTAAAVYRPNLLGHFDDPGMHPKVLILPSTNRPDLTHTTADIDGAQPCPKDVCHHPRDTNPLSPQYRLATGRCACPSQAVHRALMGGKLHVDMSATTPVALPTKREHPQCGESVRTKETPPVEYHF
jgi:hypothetical protein